MLLDYFQIDAFTSYRKLFQGCFRKDTLLLAEKKQKIQQQLKYSPARGVREPVPPVTAKEKNGP